MKPKPQFYQKQYRQDSLGKHARVAFPLTDFHFQPSSLDDFSSRRGGKRFPSFRGISEEYFRTEARKHFLTEAAVFVLISATVAVPIFQAVRGLFELVF